MCRLHLQAFLAAWFLVVSCFAYYSTLKTERTRSSEISANLCRTGRCYNPEDSILYVTDRMIIFRLVCYWLIKSLPLFSCARFLFLECSLHMTAVHWFLKT
jgi:hypothetical protein